MSSDKQYSKRELDSRFASLEHRLFHKDEGFLPRIEAQTTKHNGRMTRVERHLLIVACVVSTLLATNSRELISILKLML